MSDKEKPTGNERRIQDGGLGGNLFAENALRSRENQLDREGRDYGNGMVVWAILALAREVRLGCHEVAETIKVYCGEANP